MEYLPVQILEENDACKKLVNQHIYTIKDLQVLLNSKAEGGHALSKEVEKVLEEKISIICRGIKEGVDLPKPAAYAEKFHGLPNVVLTLNGINLVTGKRNTGKTTFALLQLLDAFVELHETALRQFLSGTIGDADYVRLANRKIVVFCLREVFYLAHFQGLLEERARRFAERCFAGQSAATLTERAGRLTLLLQHVVALVRAASLDECKCLLADMLRVDQLAAGADVFGLLLDDLSFVFNKIDSLTIKSDVRNFAKQLGQLVRQNSVAVVATDSTRFFYDEDTVDDLKVFTPSILFTCVSDIVYLTRSENMFKAAVAKSSREVVAVDR